MIYKNRNVCFFSLLGDRPCSDNTKNFRRACYKTGEMMRLILFALAVFTTSICYAQDIAVNGNSAQTDVFNSTNTSTSLTDRIGVHGVSIPSAYYGIGVRGEGAYKGVEGFSTVAGTGVRYGGYFIAGGGDAANYGVYASASATPSNYAGYFDGNVFVSGTLTQASDIALKKNVEDIGSPLNKLTKLKPKRYDLKAVETTDVNLPVGKKYGFIAQDIESIYPELVTNIKISPSGNKQDIQKTYKSVDYIQLIPILVSSIQAQQAQIDSLKNQIQLLQK